MNELEWGMVGGGIKFTPWQTMIYRSNKAHHLFLEIKFIKTQPPSFIYMLPVIAFMLKRLYGPQAWNTYYLGLNREFACILWYGTFLWNRAWNRARTYIKFVSVSFSGVLGALIGWGFYCITWAISMEELHLKWICNRLEKHTIVNALKDVLYQGSPTCILRNASNL